ncbi:hypothetical protein HDV00_002504 [Rhizophlyctis rosea]|nr:hypothetical protein HDV00_002504 [Rhizophlyctis rosea]
MDIAQSWDAFIHMIRKFAMGPLMQTLRIVLPALVDQGYTVTTISEVYGNGPYTWDNVVIRGGGFVPAIIFNPSERNLIYFRHDIGGCYRWNETTQSWKQLLAWVPRSKWGWSGVESIATDPVDTRRLYAAVGSYTNDWDPNNGAILISTNKGDTWDNNVTLPFKFGGNEAGRGAGERLQVDPNSNNILFFGTRGNGLWKSTDYGVTWFNVTSFPVLPDYTVNNLKIGILWVTFDPTSSSAGSPTNAIYVGVAANSTAAPRIYWSSNAGSTWAPLAAQPTSGYFPHHAVLSPSTGYMYITYSNDVGPSNGDAGSVWRYGTRDNTWRDITPPPSTSDSHNGYGGVTVDEAAGAVMVVTSNLWWPDANLFRSLDRGITWTPIWTMPSYPQRTLRYKMDASSVPWLNFGLVDSATDPAPAVRLGWWIDALAIDPFNSDRIFWGTGATIYTSPNLTNWDKGLNISIIPSQMGVEDTAGCDLISPPSGTPHLLTALMDLGGLRHDYLTLPPKTIFTNPILTTGRIIDFAELAPDNVVIVGEANNKPVIAFSTDQGNTWSPAAGNRSDVTGYGSVAINADGSAVVWAPSAANAVYVTSNRGSTWTVVSGLGVGAHVAADRVNPAKFYGLVGGVVYVSVDKGKTFTRTSPQLTVSGFTAYKPFKAVPGYEGHLWIACAWGGLQRSIDGGGTFGKVAWVDTAYAVGFGKAAPNQTYPAIYLSAAINGTDGIHRSDDEGATWVRVNDDQHQYGDTGACITGDPRVYGRVYICSNGYGIPFGKMIGEVIDSSTTTPTTATTSGPSATATSVGTTIYAGKGVLGTGWDDWSWGGAVNWTDEGPPTPIAGTTIVKALLGGYGAISFKSSGPFTAYKTMVVYIASNGTSIVVRVQSTAKQLSSDGVVLSNEAVNWTGTVCEAAIVASKFVACKLDLVAFGANPWDRVAVMNQQDGGAMIALGSVYLSMVRFAICYVNDFFKKIR